MEAYSGNSRCSIIFLSHPKASPGHLPRNQISLGMSNGSFMLPPTYTLEPTESHSTTGNFSDAYYLPDTHLSVPHLWLLNSLHRLLPIVGPAHTMCAADQPPPIFHTQRLFEFHTQHLFESTLITLIVRSARLNHRPTSSSIPQPQC